MSALLASARAALGAAAAAFADGWNAHDADALASAFAADAMFVNRFGRKVRGRADIAAMHAPLFTSVYQGSRIACRLEEVELLGDGAASGVVRFDLQTGEAMAGGAQSVPGRMFATMQRQGETWTVKAVMNVAMVDPRSGQPDANI